MRVIIRVGVLFLVLTAGVGAYLLVFNRFNQSKCVVVSPYDGKEVRCGAAVSADEGKLDVYSGYFGSIDKRVDSYYLSLNVGGLTPVRFLIRSSVLTSFKMGKVDNVQYRDSDLKKFDYLKGQAVSVLVPAGKNYLPTLEWAREQLANDEKALSDIGEYEKYLERCSIFFERIRKGQDGYAVKNCERITNNIYVQ